MYLFTVRGRKSGQPRTISTVIVEQDGERSPVSPFGVVDWVHNLRARGVAILTGGRRHEEVRARERPRDEAGQVLKELITSGKNSAIVGSFGVTADSSREDFERAAASHPVVVVERNSASAAGSEISDLFPAVEDIPLLTWAFPTRRL